jgi:hypothetical protein
MVTRWNLGMTLRERPAADKPGENGSKTPFSSPTRRADRLPLFFEEVTSGQTSEDAGAEEQAMTAKRLKKRLPTYFFVDLHTRLSKLSLTHRLLADYVKAY